MFCALVPVSRVPLSWVLGRAAAERALVQVGRCLTPPPETAEGVWWVSSAVWTLKSQEQQLPCDFHGLSGGRVLPLRGSR